MNIKKLYEVGIDYKSGVQRCMGNCVLYENMLALFVEENDFYELVDIYNKRDYKKLFEYVHMMKGIAGNLSMKGLYDECFMLVETLRAKNYKLVDEMIGSVLEEYELVLKTLTEAIKETDNRKTKKELVNAN